MSVDIEKIIREYIKVTPHLSLATVSGNKPWVCEVHFAPDEDLNLYFVSRRTTRHCQEIIANSHVAGNIVKQHALDEAPEGVYFEGDAVEIEAPTDEQIGIYCTALQRNQAQLAAQLRDTKERSMFRITIKNWAVFGNFDGSGHAKNELSWGKA